MTDTKRINLALQGGGSHGAYTWGVLDALIEDGRLEIEGRVDLHTALDRLRRALALERRVHGVRDGARDE